MKSRSVRVWTWSVVLAVIATFASFAIAKAGPPAANSYVVRNLVSDGTIALCVRCVYSWSLHRILSKL